MEFRRYRSRIKAPLTDRAELLCLSDLDKLVTDGYDQEEVMNQTFKSGKWKSFYPPKERNDTDAFRRVRAKYVKD